MLFDLDVSTAEGAVVVVTVARRARRGHRARAAPGRWCGSRRSRRRTRIVVDLAGVDFIDSTGLGVVVGGLKRVRAQDGALVLARAEPQVRKVFEITRLTRSCPCTTTSTPRSPRSQP